MLVIADGGQLLLHSIIFEVFRLQAKSDTLKKKMKILHKNAFSRGVVLPALTTILVCGALGLAIIDQKTRPAYFDVVKTAVICYFQTSKKSGNGGK